MAGYASHRWARSSDGNRVPALRPELANVPGYHRGDGMERLDQALEAVRNPDWMEISVVYTFLIQTGNNRIGPAGSQVSTPDSRYRPTASKCRCGRREPGRQKKLIKAQVQNSASFSKLWLFAPEHTPQRAKVLLSFFLSFFPRNGKHAHYIIGADGA